MIKFIKRLKLERDNKLNASWARQLKLAKLRRVNLTNELIQINSFIYKVEQKLAVDDSESPNIIRGDFKLMF